MIRCNRLQEATTVTDPNYTALLIIGDRSGSMQSIRSAAEEAVNGFIVSQREVPGRCTVRLVQFDDEVAEVYPYTDVHATPYWTLVPRNTTALLDAIGKSVAELGQELATMDEDARPGKVIVVIQTDGLENASAEYTTAMVSEAIRRQREEYGWEFVFLGANMDAVATAASMGIPMASSMTYGTNDQGTRSAVASASAYVATTRGGGHAAFSDEDRAAALGEDDALPPPRPTRQGRSRSATSH
jgi:hypothetical protein